MADFANDTERELLIEQLRRQAAERGGVTGGADVRGSLDQGLAPEAAVPPPAAAAAAPASSYNMRGFDAGKMAGGSDSEKYKMGRVFQKYDPKGGVTPEMLAELNAMGIAEFSGGGDKLTVNNTKNDPRFGRGGTADVVYGIKGQNADTAWQPWFIDEGGGAGAPGASAQGAPMMSGAGGDSAFQSLAPTDSDFFQKLMAQAGNELGGMQAFDREALLKMLGAQ